MSDKIKGCVACGAIYVMPETWYCDRCRCAGHISRLKTEEVYSYSNFLCYTIKGFVTRHF